MALSGDISNISLQSVPEISVSVPGEEMTTFVVKRFQRRPTLPIHGSQGSSQAVEAVSEDRDSPKRSQVDLCALTGSADGAQSLAGFSGGSTFHALDCLEIPVATIQVEDQSMEEELSPVLTDLHSPGQGDVAAAEVGGLLENPHASCSSGASTLVTEDTSWRVIPCMDQSSLPVRRSDLHFSAASELDFESWLLDDSLEQALPAKSAGPKARPDGFRVPTSRPSSLHRVVHRDVQASRPRPPAPSLRSLGLPRLGCPKPRPVPKPRGFYASYPSETERMAAGAMGAVSKASAQCATPASVIMSPPGCMSPSNQAVSGIHKRLLGVSGQEPESLGSKTQRLVVKSSDIHSSQWSKALRLWRELCELACSCSSLLQEILESANASCLLEQLLRRISDTTALRYIAVLWSLVCTLRDLGMGLVALSQVQLLDAIHVLQHSNGGTASVHSINVLKALRWFASTVKPDSFPSLYDGLFHSKSWQTHTCKREAVPLPLGFIHWLEVSIILGDFTLTEIMFAGGILLCVWSSLRFSDSQHLHLQDIYIDEDSIRGVCYRTKAKSFMPFGCLVGGLCRMPVRQSWVMHWLHAFSQQVELDRATGEYPDYIFVHMSAGELRPLSYAECLSCLRQFLSRWGRLPSDQILQYTLHSMKVTLLAFYRQANVSIEARHLQGHHVFAPSSTLYGRDDISPILLTQHQFVHDVHSGWRPRTPVLRGVTYLPSEPAVELDAVDLTSVQALAEVHFFHVGLAPRSMPRPSDVEGQPGPLMPSHRWSLDPHEAPGKASAGVTGDAVEEETSDSDAALGQADEVGFLCAETSNILHACFEGRPACNSRGAFRGVTHPARSARLCRARACAAVFSQFG